MQLPTLATLANGQQLSSVIAAINSNFQIVANALENTLDRYGSSPNQYQATLDMNSNQIINLPSPSTLNSPARLVDVASNPTISINPTFTTPVVLNTYTVATLPSSVKGAIACVTDLQSQIGPGVLVSTVGGSGTVASIVFYNGSHWAGI